MAISLPELYFTDILWPDFKKEKHKAFMIINKERDLVKLQTNIKS